MGSDQRFWRETFLNMAPSRRDARRQRRQPAQAQDGDADTARRTADDDDRTNEGDGAEGAFERWGTFLAHTTHCTVRGVRIALDQDPTTDQLGHSVWDVARAVARFLELDTWWRRELGRHRHAVELGAGNAVGVGALAHAPPHLRQVGTRLGRTDRQGAAWSGSRRPCWAAT